MSVTFNTFYFELTLISCQCATIDTGFFLVLIIVPMPANKIGYPILRESYTINMQIQTFFQQMAVELTLKNPFHIFQIVKS